MTADWKNYLLKYKWMPTRQLIVRFGIQKHDIDNFRRKSEVRSVLHPWRVSLNQPPERLREILVDAWAYYLTEVQNIDFDSRPASWVPDLIATRNVSKSGFSFLTDSKYLKLVCPNEYDEFRKSGYTNIALAAYEFWPGRSLLHECGVLPHMFQQTHSSALKRIDALSMVEHIYLNFLSGDNGNLSSEQLRHAKEILYARYREPGFITGQTLSSFGVPANFYSQGGGLKPILTKLHHKYGVELGYVTEAGTVWSSRKFRERFPNRNLDKCLYCNLSPVDLHHLLPRQDHPNLIYDGDNVVPLCVNVHQRITRKRWTKKEEDAYNKASKRWLKTADSKLRRQVFNKAMEKIHSEVYGEWLAGKKRKK